MKNTKLSLVLLLTLFRTSLCFSQYLQTDKGIFIKANESIKNTLIVFIGGTGSKPNDNLLFCNHASKMGYDVAIVDYPNKISSMDLFYLDDSSAYEKFHEEIIFGNNVSSIVEVDENNCILSNLKSILNTANKKFEGVLTSYMSNSKINFSKIIFAGHSQGSGHAAYVGSKYLCSKILLFSGPNDFLKKLNYQPAWFSKTTATPKEKIIAILHEKDEVVDFSIQKNNVEKLNNCFNTCNEMYFQQQKCNCIFLSKDNYKMVEKFHNISVRDEYEMKEIWNFILSD